MNRESFCDQLIERLNEKYGPDGWKARLLREGYTSTEPKELNIIKDTNRRYFGNDKEILGGDFVIIENGAGALIRQEIDYLINSYNDEGWDFVASIFEKNVKVNERGRGIITGINDFLSVKDKIIVKVINYRINESDLEGRVYRRIGDFVIVLYILAFIGEGSLVSFMVPKSVVETWGITDDEAIELGLENSSVLFPPRVYNLETIFRHQEKDVGIFMDYGDGSLDVDQGVLRENVFTAYENPNGSVCFFYPGVQERIAEMLGGEDYYVVFTSIKEFHVHRCAESNPARLKLILMQSNEKLPRKEMLTDKVYKYSVSSGELTEMTI